ncbi:MAG: radical SAM protein [Parcubacteria group bacterium]|nr:radical SAM protein [Parcubacteria group bacterium]MCR4342523.1 radical SAM protein [Patescibacteria group bacterium]
MEKKVMLPSVKIPEPYNYIAVFLTLACNLKCSYCINDFESGSKKKGGELLSGDEWITGLKRIISRSDLPVTLQGGEPSLHKDFIYILNNIKSELHVDVLTNLQFNVDEFIKKVDPNRVKRESPYASIRVSYHPEQVNLGSLVNKVLKMQYVGFHIGIWGVMHPAQKGYILDAQRHCLYQGIDFRLKEFLGEHKGKMYGEYKYPEACNRESKKTVLCKTTELIIGPDGSVYRCTADLYEGREPVGHILDPDFRIEDKYRPCNWYGHCNPCDIKVKTNRHQKFGHTSVDIIGA